MSVTEKNKADMYPQALALVFRRLFLRKITIASRRYHVYNRLRVFIKVYNQHSFVSRIRIKPFHWRPSGCRCKISFRDCGKRRYFSFVIFNGAIVKSFKCQYSLAKDGGKH